jgi:CheY-like chemotaxis protein
MLLHKVLVVDDEEIVRRVVSMQLKTLGYHSDCAQNGAEALEKARDNHYSIILMDIQMPVMDGFEATSKIRDLQVERGTGIPIIAMTASPDRVGCMHVGMDDYLFKPVMLEDLSQAILRWLPQESLT